MKIDVGNKQTTYILHIFAVFPIPCAYVCVFVLVSLALHDNNKHIKAKNCVLVLTFKSAQRYVLH